MADDDVVTFRLKGRTLRASQLMGDKTARLKIPASPNDSGSGSSSDAERPTPRVLRDVINVVAPRQSTCGVAVPGTPGMPPRTPSTCKSRNTGSDADKSPECSGSVARDVEWASRRVVSARPSL
jgi:hypothetical protein